MSPLLASLRRRCPYLFALSSSRPWFCLVPFVLTAPRGFFTVSPSAADRFDHLRPFGDLHRQMHGALDDAGPRPSAPAAPASSTARCRRGTWTRTTARRRRQSRPSAARWPRPTATPWQCRGRRTSWRTGAPRAPCSRPCRGSKSSTRPAFCAEVRVYFAVACALHHRLTPFLPRPARRAPPRRAAYAALRPAVWPRNWRVGANSPSLWPTMFSVTKTGTCSCRCARRSCARPSRESWSSGATTS